MITDDSREAIALTLSGQPFVIYNGDCRDLLAQMPDQTSSLTVTSPPYFLGKTFDVSKELGDFSQLFQDISNDIANKSESGGNVCWQVGNYIKNGEITPLDFIVHGIFSQIANMTLRNRIVWTFGHGTHARTRFSGRHESILWYSNGEEYFFDLDAARVPQKYRGKKHYKGPKKGQWSSNPKGKNPGDVWDIPNVKANHVEKTSHPCQFPVALAQRLVRALCRPDGLVFDPFSGVASTGIAAALEGRRYLGAEISLEYCEISEQRYSALNSTEPKVRPIDRPVFEPDPRSSVATDPFLTSERR